MVGLAAVAVAGCGGTGGRPPPAPALSGQSALDAQATLAVWSAQGTAVVVETRRVEQATADAQAAAVRATEVSAGATAGAMQAAEATSAAYGTAVAVEATATAGSMQAAATAQAGQATAAWDALVIRQQQMAMEATATADAAALAFQEQQATKALAARQAEIDRTILWTRITPWLVGAVVVVVVGLAFALAAMLVVERLRRTRPQQAGDVWVMVGPNGPTLLNRPPAQLTAGLPRAALTVEAGHEPPIVLPEMRRGHVLIAGPTNAGKSTAMREVLRTRGGNVVVLDPHYSAEEGWGAARVVGGGRDYEAIRDYMDEMGRMLRERYEARAGGQTSFDPLTVAVDEMPAIVDAVGRDIEKMWRQWLREGRKVGLFLVLSTQSMRVKTLGIEGERDLLENFTFALVLGETARREYPAVVNGMARPAALVTQGRARPVVIPHHDGATVTSIPAGDLDGDGDADVILLPPLFTAPAPRPKADPRDLRPEDAARIRELLANGFSQRAVEEDLFGYTGGAAWEAVRRVIGGDEASAHNGRNGYAPTPDYYQQHP